MQREIPQASKKSRRKLVRLSEQNRIFIDVFDNGQVQVISEYPTVWSSSERTVIRNFVTAPLHPSLLDGNFPSDYYESSPDSLSEWSYSVESTISEDGATPDDEMTLEVYGDNPIFSVPVIELPSEQTTTGFRQQEVRKPDAESRQSVSIVGNVRGHAVGAVIEPSSTVLMQLSTSQADVAHQRIMDCVRQANELLDNEESVVILNYPGVEESQSSRRTFIDHRRATLKMIEMAEDVLRRVQGSSRESILVRLQDTLKEILNQPENTVVVHSYSRENLEVAEPKSDAFVGYFSKDQDMALYVQTPLSRDHLAGSFSGSEDDEDRMPLDRLRSFLRNSMIDQEEIMDRTLSTEPAIIVSQSGNKIVGVLSFPDTSSGLVTTTSDRFPIAGNRDEMVKSTRDLFRKLVQQPSEKLLIQVHSDEDRSIRVKQIKQDLDQTVRSDSMEDKLPGISVRESEDKIIGVLSYAGGSVVIQTSSKNWIKHQTHGNSQDLLVSIRLLMEKFIMNNELSEEDMKRIATIIAAVFHSEKLELSKDFLAKPLLEKIRSIVRQLLMPAEDENPLEIISQIQETLQDVAQQKSTSSKAFETANLLRNYFEELVCDEDSEFEANDILQALRDGLLEVLVHYETSLSSALGELLELLNTIPVEASGIDVSSCPGVTLLTDRQQEPPRHSEELDIQSREVIQQVHDLLSEEGHVEDRTVTYMSIFQALFLTLVNIFAGWSLKVKAFLNKVPEPPLKSEPSSLGRKPSVSFHLVPDSDDETPPDLSEQLQQEGRHLNETIDELRQYLERSLDVPDSWQRERRGSLLETERDQQVVKDRMLLLFGKLLEESGKLKVTERSAETIHLRLESASGDLVRRETDRFVVLSGNVRDRQHNLGLFFEARLVDLKHASEVESEVECVTEVRRLSDEQEDVLVQEVLPQIVESCSADVGSARDEVVESEPQQPWMEDGLRENLSRYFGMIQNFIQESVEPMRETMNMILDHMSSRGAERIRELRSSFAQAGSSLIEDYIVELQESGEEIQIRSTEAEYDDKCVQSESLESSKSHIKDEDVRMMRIESDLHEIKDKLQMLDRIYESLMHPRPSSQSKSEDLSLEIDILPSAPPFDELEIVSSKDFDAQSIENLEDARIVKIYERYSRDSISSSDELETAVQCSEIDEEVVESETAETTIMLSTVSKTESELVESMIVVTKDTSQDLLDVQAETIDDQRLSDHSVQPLESREEFISTEICSDEYERNTADKALQTGSLPELIEDVSAKIMGSQKLSDSKLLHISDEAILQSEEHPKPDELVVALDSSDPTLKLFSSQEFSQESQLQTTDRIHREHSEDTFLSSEKCPSVAAGVDDGTFKISEEVLTSHESLRKISQLTVLETEEAITEDVNLSEQLTILVPESIAEVIPQLTVLEDEEATTEYAKQPEQLTDLLPESITDEIPDDHSNIVPQLTVLADEMNAKDDTKRPEQLTDLLPETINEDVLDDHSIIIPEVPAIDLLEEESHASYSALNIDSEKPTSKTKQSIAETPVITLGSLPEKTFESSTLEAKQSSYNRLDIELPTASAEVVVDIIKQKTMEPAEVDQQLIISDSSQEGIAQESFTHNDFSSHENSESIESPSREAFTDQTPVEQIVEVKSPKPSRDRTQDSASTNLENHPSVTVLSRHSTHSTSNSSHAIDNAAKAILKGEQTKRSSLCSLALSYLCPSAGSQKRYACPVEIYSCHQVGPNQLMVHWNVAGQFLDQIEGYKIQLNGELAVICYSRRRRTALLENVDVNRQHWIAIYATPKASIGDHIPPWSPGVFFYHR
ncbi:uncharacterized protein LOC128739751 [Sabethes cyaneus]|uniref:uncharacterized protein LOC128739751 n=1 Tax=Sabethes cyaneus TaxID=53552 RepID=UPI00237D9875|nr:uncharacterized protein LOC128739751 [Sabethes cyaneus]